MNNITIQGETNATDKGALVCDLIMLAICLWNQLHHKMDMWFLIIPLALIGVFLVLFGMFPETYRFADNDLQITHKFRKTISIPYETVFNYDASARDSFLNITQKNTVKVYHTVGKKKRLTICKPCDTESFVQALKTNCSVFHQEAQKSQLDVFFKHPDQNNERR